MNRTGTGNLLPQITDIGNLRAADKRAQRAKKNQPGVIAHNLVAEENLLKLQRMLEDGTYRTSPYITFTITDPKEREIYRLPYFPDRICHHAIMRVLMKYFVSHFTADTYSCIEGKGIGGAQRAVKRALRDVAGTQYCLKLDVRKFYPSVDHETLKALLRRKFKDQRLLALLDEIIDSCEGLPIGNYLSQYFANFYLSGFDHWLKEVKGVKHYFRYADDMVLLAATKPELHALMGDIRTYLATQLKLQVKSNWQVFPVEARGIDFVGYVFRHRYVRIRKSIKQNCARKMKRTPEKSRPSYNGWLSHGNCRHLSKKLLAA